jgi:hypothetical protein
MRRNLGWLMMVAVASVGAAGCGSPGSSPTEANADLAPVPSGSAAEQPPATSAQGLLSWVEAETLRVRANTCAIDMMSIRTAIEAFAADTGAYPESEAQLVGLYFDRELEFHHLLPNGEIVAAGDCIGVPDLDSLPPGGSDDEGRAAGQHSCEIDKRVLRTAVEDFMADTGDYPVSEDELVEDYLPEPSADYDLGPDHAVVPAPGGGCEPVG